MAKLDKKIGKIIAGGVAGAAVIVVITLIAANSLPLIALIGFLAGAGLAYWKW